MTKLLYCWRCKAEIPMLDEEEWAQIAPKLGRAIDDIKEYRMAHGASLAEAKEKMPGDGALKRYFEITGCRVQDIDAIRHHRLRLFGPPCGSCGRPLRTPQAKLCAECGAPR